MIEELLSGLQQVWDFPAVIAAIAGGLAIGYAIGSVQRRRYPADRWAGLTLSLGTLSVCVFWAGQVVESIVSADPSWGRAVARALLNELFVLAAAGASYLLWRQDHKRKRS